LEDAKNDRGLASLPGRSLLLGRIRWQRIAFDNRSPGLRLKRDAFLVFQMVNGVRPLLCSRGTLNPRLRFTHSLLDLLSVHSLFGHPCGGPIIHPQESPRSIFLKIWWLAALQDLQSSHTNSVGWLWVSWETIIVAPLLALQRFKFFEFACCPESETKGRVTFPYQYLLSEAFATD